MTEAEKIAKGLTEAQRRAVLESQRSCNKGVWHEAGFYASADKRVRYALARRGLTKDYLRRSNILTPLGLEVRRILEKHDAE